ncbi:MAG: epoxyqueuosine reductase QueH [Cyanobacteriota bacterium]
MSINKNKLLLHTCCAPCIIYVHRLLKPDYEVSAYYYNPNIYPEEEYERRKTELINYCNNVNLQLNIANKEFNNWLEVIRGLEHLPEGHERCWKCFEMRLEKTAVYAKINGFNIFTTTLSISPHKNAAKINEIGFRLSEKHNINFLEADFKKNDGFKKAVDLSKQFNLYRQTYCGCKYSVRNK